jgi:hypothetical protein
MIIRSSFFEGNSSMEKNTRSKKYATLTHIIDVRRVLLLAALQLPPRLT